AVDAAADAGAAQPVLLHAVLELLGGQIGILQRHRREGDEAVGMGGAGLAELRILDLTDLPGEIALGLVPVRVDAERLDVVAALAIGWAAAGVAGKTSAARETGQLKQQVSTLQARLHAREEIAAARSSDAGGRPGTPSASRASAPGERGLAAAVTEDRVLRDLRARGGGPADRAASRPGSSGSSPSIEAALDRFYRYLEA